MQSWILDFDFYKSTSYLDRNRLQANIYENIHILASLLDINNKLVNPKRNVKNHPVSKLWIGYEKELLSYIHYHIRRWQQLGYKSKINIKNVNILVNVLCYDIRKPYEYKTCSWITDELIDTHRSVLIQKEIEKEKKIIRDGVCDNPNYYDINNKKIKQNYHYRNLWSDCPKNLKMRYDWRS